MLTKKNISIGPWLLVFSYLERHVNMMSSAVLYQYCVRIRELAAVSVKKTFLQENADTAPFEVKAFAGIVGVTLFLFESLCWITASSTKRNRQRGWNYCLISTKQLASWSVHKIKDSLPVISSRTLIGT